MYTYWDKKQWLILKHAPFGEVNFKNYPRKNQKKNFF
jgi:hypothetical protein